MAPPEAVGDGPHACEAQNTTHRSKRSIEPNRERIHERLQFLRNCGQKPGSYLDAELSVGLNTASQSTVEELCNNALRVQMEFNDEKRALALYEEVLKHDNNHIRSLSYVGAIYHRRGYLDKARERYNQVLKLSPNRYKTVYNLARLAHDEAKYEEAVFMYEKCLSLDCDEDIACKAMAFLGLIYQEVWADYEQASKCYEASLSINPSDERTLDHKCALLVLTDRREEARVLHQTILEENPRHSRQVCAYLNSLFTGDLLAAHKCHYSSEQRDSSSDTSSETQQHSDVCATLPQLQHKQGGSFLRRVAARLKVVAPSKGDE